MGTPEEKAHRARAGANRARILAAVSGGKWTTDSQLSDYLSSIGLKPDGPMFKQYFSGGGFATYGPSWNPGVNNDFVTGMEIPWQGKNPQDFPWYDPTIPGNWKQTDPTAAANMKSFYDWRDQNLAGGINIDANFGGNAFAAWMQGHGGAPTLGGLAGAAPSTSPPVTPPVTTTPPLTPPTETPPLEGATLGDLTQQKPKAWNDWTRYGL